jgi:Carboxypeptidase regulatory-like domain/von Willebrand factor type A domain
MDNMVRVEGCGSVSLIRTARSALRAFALATLAGLTACGGGGGGGDGNGGGNPPPDPTGQIAATVVDTFNAPINGATVTATAGTTTRTGTTAADGTGTVTQVPTGAVSVSATANGFSPSAAQNVTVNANAATTVTFTLQRVAQATGGVLTALPVALDTTTGSTYTFRMRIVVIDQDFDPVEGLAAAAFTLENCEHVVETPERPNCVRNSGPNFDADYTVSPATPANFEVLPPEPGSPFPYAAALLLDSSGSIRDSDPTDARIFAGKVFLGGVGSGDQVMLSAFADQFDNPPLIPDPPLTIYPCAPSCQVSPFTFTNDGNSLFASLDSLADQESGGTPLHDSLSSMIVTVDDTADALPAPPANLRRAVVLFSDGEDIYCAVPPFQPPATSGFEQCINERQAIITQGQTRDVRIFTVGLTEEVNSLAMAELAIGSGGAYMFAENTEQLIPIYGSLGRLLSGSLPTYEMDWTVTAAAGTFSTGRAVLGRLNVNTGATTFTLPFVVQIFPPP